MDLSYSPEQEAFRRSVREFVTDRVPPDRLAEIADGDEGWDPALWKEAAGLGLAAISTSEDRGGAGMGFVEEAIAAEELGRAVFPGPWLGSAILAPPGLASAPELLTAVATGDRIATYVPKDGRHVVDLQAADLLVLETSDDRLLAVEKEQLEWKMLPTIDGTRRLGEVNVEGAAGSPLAEGRTRATIAEAIRIRALAAQAAEAVGVAERALEIATDYAKEREQFGKRIGAFQAVGHQLADTFMDVELSRSLTMWAAAAIDAEDGEAPLAAAQAKAFAADAAVRATERSVQVHGGIGFTWEHVLHRLYKRALWIRAFWGGGQELRADAAGRLIG